MTPTSNQNVFSPFPDILATPAEKASADYGKQYARAIWGRHTVNILQYNTQRQRDIINRQYREGLESVEKFKTITISDTNIVGIKSIIDNDGAGNTWYEVPFLGQDTVFTDSSNNASPDSSVACHLQF